MEVPQKLKIELLYDAAVPPLGIYPKEMKSVSQRDMCIPTFTAALFTIPKIRDCASKGAGTGPRGSGDKAGAVGKDA